jgi:hypothetical protein
LEQVSDEETTTAYDVRRFVDMLLRRARTVIGEIQTVHPVGSLASPIPADSGRTILKLTGEHGDSFLSVVWHKGNIDGIRPVQSGLSVAVPFLATADGDFAGYHIAIARNISASFDLAPDGSVGGVTVQSDDGPVRALRVDRTAGVGCQQ